MQQEPGYTDTREGNEGNPHLELQAKEKQAAQGSLFLRLFLKCQSKQMA